MSSLSSAPADAPVPFREEDVEAATLATGRRVWDLIGHRKPSFFEKRWWDDQIMSAAMADESLKIQMFRFVDVLPRLKSHDSVTRHLQEYFEEVRTHLPWAAQMLRFGVEHLPPESMLSRVLAYNARNNALRMARRFIAGDNVDDVLGTVSRLRDKGFAFTLDLLGEAVISEEESRQYQQQYLDLLTHLTPTVNAWGVDEQLDWTEAGTLPRMNLSIKLSALTSRFRPIDPSGTTAAVLERLRPILRLAREQGAYIHVDMEQSFYKDLTRRIFQQVLMEDEFRDWPDAGIVVQAYLKDSGDDLAELARWARERGTPITIRLVKGAYWDYERIVAHANNWPVPVYEHKWETDENYERLTRVLLDNRHWLRPAFGSHNIRSLSHAIAYANAQQIPASEYELQFLYGMAEDQAQVFQEMGHRVRIYAPFGELIPGMAYLVRRLLENTSNDSFLRQAYTPKASTEDLLMKPSLAAKKQPVAKPAPVPEFVNEPLSDFSQDGPREAMQEALENVESRFGETYAAIINGRREETRNTLTIKNPSNTSQTVGKVVAATEDMALAAIDAARRAIPRWATVEPSYRAEYLDLIARELRNRRFELAAWQVYECGKPWAEADADVAEAIDFCVYYAVQMRKLADPERYDFPGEEGASTYRPRGVAVVIAPWNFPLAILTGMTVAALVSGNTVVMKPAEQSSITAAKLMEIFQQVGLPDGVVNFLPGVGEDLGPILTQSPNVDVIAFTGSMQVGLDINRQAAEPHAKAHSIKHVLAELGGKNAIIVDADADLDEAVVGVVHSAFGYSGQKCSACSRVIVLDEVYNDFLNRLVEATKALTVAAAHEPACQVGPVISKEAVSRMRATIEQAQTEAHLELAGELPAGLSKGHYLAPHIFTNVNPQSSLAQDEIFGPVLAVFRVKDLGEALNLANDTRFALTGGLYSRSPANIRRVKQQFLVGNLYINRPITGALVGRQPFGGFRMSGTGSKAGGPDYLKHFMIPVHITENTMRRGYAPGQAGEDQEGTGE